jgi:8-oxo-dGTP pyrophosphatase MutT (NUDIX family)
MSTSATPIRDFIWRTIYRVGYPIATLWWRIRRPYHTGALVVVYVSSKILLLRPSYRREWNLPGGGVRKGETPEQAARRELEEETGIVAPPLQEKGQVKGVWKGRRETVYFFELRLDQKLPVTIDNREIIEADFVPAKEVKSRALTGPVEIYLRDQLQA